MNHKFELRKSIFSIPNFRGFRENLWFPYRKTTYYFQSINREIAVKMNRKLPLRNIKIIISTKISKFLFSVKILFHQFFFIRRNILLIENFLFLIPVSDVL